MFTQFSRLRLPTFGFGSKAPTVDIPPVEIHDVEEAADKRPRTLKHLIRANHVNHSIIYHNLQFHNHNNHVRSHMASNSYISVALSSQPPDTRLGLYPRRESGAPERDIR